jgi:hypothetical protein
MELLPLEWKVFLAGFDWLGLAAAWAYPAACAVMVSLALLARSRMVLLLVVLLLMGGFVPFGGSLLQGLALILSAITVSHGLANLQRRSMMMQVLEAIAAQDARLDAFMAAIDHRNTLLDRRAMVASQASLERAEAEPDLS